MAGHAQAPARPRESWVVVVAMKEQQEQKTLKQVLDEARDREVGATSKFDVKVRFDGRDYSLINLRNFLAPWHECQAYATESGNIKFIPHGGDVACYIKIIGNDSE